MAQLSPKVREKSAAKWEAALKDDLYEGEVIWAFVHALRSRPLTGGVAITNARILGIYPAGTTTEGRIKLEVRADEIRGMDFPSRLGTPKMIIHTDDGEVFFGNFHSDEVDFTRYYVQYLWDSGFDTEVAAGLERRNQQQVRDENAERDRQAQAAAQAAQAAAEQEAALARLLERRNGVTLIGNAMKDSWWEAIGRHAHGDELPWFVINAGQAGRLAAFEDRLLISKTGGLTSFMAGALGGGRETVFPYSEITNIQYNGGMVNGVLEILTPSFKGSGKHDFWRSSNNDRNSVDDDPWKLPNCLPLGKADYRQAQPLLNEVQKKVIASKRSHQFVQQVPGPAPATPNGLADELERLADMHKKGLLDVDEFKAAKQAAIARNW